MTMWHVLLLAGQRPGTDPLAEAFGREWKALVPLAGRPMLARCIENLLAVAEVAGITVLSQNPDALLTDPQVRAAANNDRVRFEISGAGIASSVKSFAGRNVPWPVLVTTADHPLLKPATASAFLAAAGDCDVAVGMVERKVVRSAFPDNIRTWLHFQRGSWTGANLFALNGPAAAHLLDVWAEVEQHRKKGWRLIARFGPMLLLRALTRTITLDAALGAAGRKFGVKVKAVALGDPLAAVDIDKLSDHALATRIIEGGG